MTTSCDVAMTNSFADIVGTGSFVTSSIDDDPVTSSIDVPATSSTEVSVTSSTDVSVTLLVFSLLSSLSVSSSPSASLCFLPLLDVLLWRFLVFFLFYRKN